MRNLLIEIALPNVPNKVPKTTIKIKKVESIISQIPPIEPLKNKQKKVVGGTPQKQEITKGEEKNWIIRLDVSTAFLIEIETISRKKGLSKQGYILKILEEIIEKNASGQQSFLLEL